MDKEYLQLICQLLSKRLPDNTGFILLTYPLNTEDGRMTYASNSNREDCISAMKEFLIKSGHAEDWMTHIK